MTFPNALPGAQASRDLEVRIRLRFQTYLFSMLFEPGRESTGRPWHLGNSSHPEKLPSLILTLLSRLTHHLPCSSCGSAITGQMSGAGWQGWGLREEKAETKETGIHRTVVSSRQGVNVGPSRHTGVMSQGQD